MLKLSLSEKPINMVINESLRMMEKGGIVAYPTESFYALGVRADDKTAVEKLYRLKKRPLEKAMPVIVGSEITLRSIVKSIPEQAERLMKEFWPGPLTIIFEACLRDRQSRSGINIMLTGGKNNIAVRIPGQGFALYMARAADFPITATSANLSGEPPAQTPRQLTDYFSEGIDLIVDAGKTPGGKPSTIIDVTVSPPRVLRDGSILTHIINS